MNESILSANEGDDVSFVINGLLNAQVNVGGVSGHVPPGIYVLQTRSAKLVKKKSGQGFNVHFEDIIIEPEAHAGTPIHSYRSVPVGDPAKDKTVASAIRDFRDRMLACADYAGSLAELTAQNEIELSVSSFVGQTFCATVRDGQGDYANRSEIGFMSTRAEYEKTPGPSVAAVVAAPKAAGGAAANPALSKPQSHIPEAAAAAVPAQKPAGATATAAQTAAPSTATSAVNKALGWGKAAAK
jgi:hypothetical protein